MLLKAIALERWAARLHRLEGVDGRPLLGRLAQLRELDLPAPRPRGAGTKQPLGLDDSLKLLVALEMMDAGLGTSQIAPFLLREWDTVRRLLAHGWARARSTNGQRAPRRLLAARAAALSRYADDEPGTSDLPIDLVGALDGGEIADLAEGGMEGRNLLVLDLENFIRQAAETVEASGAGTSAQFENEMALLCAEAFGTEDERRWRIEPRPALSRIPVRRRS